MTPDEAAKKSGISTANWLAARTEVPLVRARAQSWAARPSAGRRARRGVWRPSQRKERRERVSLRLFRSRESIRFCDSPERLGTSFVRHVADERVRFVTSKAEDYRRRARACLLMAGTIASDETRAALVEMAQVWTRLADEAAAVAPPGTVAESRPVMQQQQQIQSKKKTEK